MESSMPGPSSGPVMPEPSTRPWGWLHPTGLSRAKPFALTKEFHSFGRSKSCDYQFSVASQFDLGLLPVLSGVHFTIVRGDPTNADEDPIAYIMDTSLNGTFINGRKIPKNKKEKLNGEDEISISQPDLKVFVFVRGAMANWIPAEYDSKYTVQRLLGRGSFAEVRLAHDKEENILVAIKKTEKYGNNNAAISLNDVGTLRELDHINIVTLKDLFESTQHIYLVMEYVHGDTLLLRLARDGRLNDQDAKLIFYQIAEGLSYLTRMRILHGNIKPDDVLLQTSRSGDLAKISDFGLSKWSTLREFPTFTAPEVVSSNGEGNYSHKVDVWSLGATLFYSLSGDLPFDDERHVMSVQEQILRGSYQMRIQVWRSVSRPAINLVRSMLIVNPEDRMSMFEVFHHQWFQDPEMRERLTRIQRELRLYDSP